MSRYIDADLLQEDFKADHGGKRSLMIDTQPTADVRENVHGEWVHHGGDEWCCSACGNIIHTEGSWEHPLSEYQCKYFCDNCGADMRGAVKRGEKHHALH